jgi:hypothetical protein
MMNRETLSVVGVVLALAVCFYLYKELQKVQKDVSSAKAGYSSIISALTPVNDTKPKVMHPVAVPKKENDNNEE